ncbi:MAG: glycoside hydrolase family 38 C-terminal domain-containing protein [Lentisphaeria bacterium]
MKTPSASSQTAPRVTPEHLRFLEEARCALRLPLDGWEVTRHPNLARAAVDGGDANAWRPLRSPAWGEVKGTHWFRTRLVIPPELAGRELMLNLAMHADYPRLYRHFPHVVNITMHFEGLLYVNGVPLHGLDPNRSEVLLTPCAKAGEVYDLLIEAYTTSAQPKYFMAALEVPDREVRALYYDLRSLLELAGAFSGAAEPAEQELHTRLPALAADIVARLTSAPDWRRHIAPVRTEIQTALARLRSPLAGQAIDLIGHCHIDTVWMWRLAETRRKAGRTFATMLRYLDEFPEYTFLQSAPVLYEFCREDYPALYARLKAAVRAGRWCPEGAMYVEADCNLTAGESLVRQIVYGKRFFREEFGLDSQILWLPDVFGYTGSLPQLLKQAGVSLFVTTKITTEGGQEQPLSSFWWEGIDGTRVMGHFPKNYVNSAAAATMADWARSSRQRGALPLWLMPFGFGDGGGGVRKDDLEIARRWRNLPFFPKTAFTTAAAFRDRYAALAAAATPAEMPVRKNDLYLEWHRGTYTSVAKIKKWNRLCENALLRAEVWSSIAALRTGAAYPAAALERAWKRTLLNQFHDALPGSSIEAVYDDAQAIAGEALGICAERTAAALTALGGGRRRRRAPMVCNSLSHPVSGLVRVPPANAGPATQTLTELDGTVAHYAWTEPLPPWSVTPLAPRHTDPGAFHWDGITLTTPFWRAVIVDGEATVGKEQGCLFSLYDRVRDRQLLAAPGNRFQTFDDRPTVCEPWELDKNFEQHPRDIFTRVRQEVVATGPLIFVVRTTFESAASKIVQDMRFYACSPRIDFVTRCDWHERRILLKVAFPFAITAAQSVAETAFGCLRRPMTRNTPGEEQMFETPMHRFVDLSGDGYGVSLLNDGKYGYDGKGGTLRLTLLKSPGYAEFQPAHEQPNPIPLVENPVAWADQGLHEFTYSLWPHDGDLADGGTLREARLLNSPLALLEHGSAVEGFISLDTENVVAETLKGADDGNSFVLRLYEAAGRATRTRVTLDRRIATATPCNLLEEPQGAPRRLAAGRLNLQFHPFEIKSFRLGVRKSDT